MTPSTSETTTKRHEIYGDQSVRRWIPEVDKSATIVLVHGLAEHGGRYERTGNLLASAGFEVVAPDLFGFGASGGRRGDIEEWNHYWDQVEELIEEVRQTSKTTPVVLMGHSMGGLICAGYVLGDRARPDFLVLTAPALGGGAKWQKALAPVLARFAPKALVPNNLDASELSRDPDVGEAYFADPLVFTKTSARLGAAMFAAQSHVNSILDDWSIPTLVMHGGGDTIVPASSTLPLAEVDGVERRLYPKLRHEILNEPEGPDLVAEIIEWIESRLLTPPLLGKE